MKIKFPAMQATIGQRNYYATVMKLPEISTMFSFIADWIEFTPEEREQRVLNEKRVPDITRYIVDNEDGYLFSSITASYKCKENFEPVGTDGLGFLELDFDGRNFIINDGQHRCAAIRQAIRENPALRDESISVLLFPYENKQRVQQMFADLNRHVVKPNMATNIIFDHHDTLGRVTKEVCEGVTAFQGLVDKENQSLPARSDKAFTLYALYDATKELLTEKTASGHACFDELVQAAIQYWTVVSNFMPDWLKIKNREIRPVELRQENISTHSVVLRALGAAGAELMKRHPSDWKDHLAGLKAINWSKRNRDWENVCMVANSVVANRQARVATKAYVKQKLDLPVSDSEQHSIAHLDAMNRPAPSVLPQADQTDLKPIAPLWSKTPTIRPSEVRIGTAASIKVNTAVEIPLVVGNWILQQGKALPTNSRFVRQTNSGFRQSSNPKRLNNDWYIDVHGDQRALVVRGQRLLNDCGFRDVRLQVVLKNGDVL